MRTLMLLVLALLPFVGNVGAEEFKGLIGYGDRLKAITDFFVSNSHAIYVTMEQTKPDGTTLNVQYGYGLVYPNKQGKEVRSCRDKEDVERYYIICLQRAADLVLASPSFDLSKPFLIRAKTLRENRRYIRANVAEPTFFMAQFVSSFRKGSDGKYTHPDFSGLTLDLAPTMEYDLPLDTEWVRIEYRPEPPKIKALSEQSYVLDSRRGETDEMFFRDTTSLEFQTEDVILGRIPRISFMGKNVPFTVVRDGNLTPPQPVTLDISTLIQINGEPGRTITIERAETLNGPWQDEEVQIELPSYPVSYEATDPRGFYRARILNIVPQ